MKETVELERFKRAFLASTAYEFQTPLKSIVTIAGSIVQELNLSSKSSIGEKVKMIQDCAQRLSDFISDLIDLQAEKLSSHGQLTAGITHEINNPLAYLSRIIEILNEKLDHLIMVMALYSFREVESTKGEASNRGWIEWLVKLFAILEEDEDIGMEARRLNQRIREGGYLESLPLINEFFNEMERILKKEEGPVPYFIFQMKIFLSRAIEGVERVKKDHPGPPPLYPYRECI